MLDDNLFIYKILVNVLKICLLAFAIHIIKIKIKSNNFNSSDRYLCLCFTLGGVYFSNSHDTTPTTSSLHYTMHHPCTDPCPAQLARQPKPKLSPTKLRLHDTVAYSLEVIKSFFSKKLRNNQGQRFIFRTDHKHP